MAFNFCRSSVKVAVAQLCRGLGWSAVHASQLELLADLMERYIMNIAKSTQRYAEQFGRSDASFGDAVLALSDMNAMLPELLEYMKNVDPVEFPKKVPAFPVPKPCKLIYCDDTDEGDAAEIGRESQNLHPVAESAAHGTTSGSRKTVATASPDKSGQPRPMQELGNDAFRESLRFLLESDDLDIEERLGKAPDRRPPLQMSQIMRQRRPAPTVQPISITGVTSSTPMVATADHAGVAEPLPSTARLGGSELQAAKNKRDRSSSGTPAGQPSADGPPAKRLKTGKSGGSGCGASSAGGGSVKGNDGGVKTSSTGGSRSADPKRREKAAVARQRKLDQNYSALTEALTAAPLQCPPAASASGERRVGSSAPASRSASKHAAAAGAADLVTPSVGASSSSSSSSSAVQAGQSKGQRGHTATAASSSLSAVHLQHLQDTFDAVIRGPASHQDRVADHTERTIVAESDEDEDVDIEDLNQSHDQLASPPPHLLPLDAAAFGSAAAVIPSSSLPLASSPSIHPPPRTSRSTIDDIIDSVARGEDLECVAGISNDDSARPEGGADTNTGVKMLESRTAERKKHKKKKNKTRSRPPSQLVRSQADLSIPSASAVDSELPNDHRKSRTSRAAGEAAAASAASPEHRVDSPRLAGSPLSPEPDRQDHADDEQTVIDEPAIIDVVNEDLEVVNEVEVEIDEPLGEPPGRDVTGSGSSPPSVAARPPSPCESLFVPSTEAYSSATVAVRDVFGKAERQQLLLPQQAQEDEVLAASIAEKRKEKHKKEKKEKKKKKNKERHREKREAADGDPHDDGGDAAASRSSASKKSHKEHHRHHKHHHGRTESGSRSRGDDGNDGEKKHEHSKERRHHRANDGSAAAGGGDATEPRHRLPAEATAAVTVPSMPKLCLKINAKTMSTVSSGDDNASAPLVDSLSSGRRRPSSASQASAPPTAPPRPKATEIYTETEFTGGTTETVDAVPEEDESNKVWICPACQLPDDGSPMIGCDKCEEWYHWSCVGVETAPPEDAKWFCPRCRTKKPPKKKAKH